MYILIYRRIYFYKVLTQGLTQGLCRGLCQGLCRGLTPSESPSIYQYIASIYMVHCSVYMVHCSIYHVFLYIPCSLLYIPCSLIYIHGSLLYIPCFPRKKRICKIMYNLGNSNSRSHADRKAALTTAPRALIQGCVCARYQYV